MKKVDLNRIVEVVFITSMTTILTIHFENAKFLWLLVLLLF